MERRPVASKIQLQEPGVTEVFLVTWLLPLTLLPPLLLQHRRPLELRVLEAVPRPLHPPPTTRDLHRITIQDQREYFIDRRGESQPLEIAAVSASSSSWWILNDSRLLIAAISEKLWWSRPRFHQRPEWRLSLHSPRLLPFRVVVFRRWIDDRGEAEVLIVFSSTSSYFDFGVVLPRICWCARTHTPSVCVYTILSGEIARVCVYVCKSERVCTLFMSFRVSSLLSSLQKSPDLHMDALLTRPLPAPLLCDFSWQFVSLNVWWHVHLLLLYMCITGYKGVFEHSKHVRFSLLSLVELPVYLIGDLGRCFNFFFFVVIRPKPVRDFQFFPLLRFGTFDGQLRKESLLLLLLMKSSLYIWFNQYFFNTFSNQTERANLFFYARSNRISISVYSFSYSLAKEILKKAIQLLRGGN